MINRTLFLILFFCFSFGFSQTTLVAGEIAITGYFADDPDQFSFVLLTDVTTGTIIKFTDNGWTSGGNFRAGEGVLTWTASSDLPCGTHIVIADNSPFTASTGSVTDDALFDLATNGDQILAYQGAEAAPTFIYAIDFDGDANNWGANATNQNTSAIPAGLTNGINSVTIADRDNALYRCEYSFETALILSNISTRTNWQVFNAPNANYPALGLCDFYCAAPSPVLTVGDLVITGYNTDDSEADEFSFAILRDIPAGTVISFTDKGWDSGTGAFRTGGAEGYLNWIAPNGGVPCGSEVIIFAIASGVSVRNYSSNFGTVIEYDVGFGFRPQNDQVIAFQGSYADPTNLYAIQWGGSDWTNATNGFTSAVPVGLTDGVNAIYHGDNGSGVYDCSTVLDNTLIATSVSNTSNWNYLAGDNTGSQTIAQCNYSCCPVSTWDGINWNPVNPIDINTTAILNANYNTTTHGSFRTCSLIINSGNTLTVTNGRYVEVQNDVTVNGNLTVQSEGNFIQNNDFSSFTINPSGNAELNKNKILSRKFEYTYWGSPVVDETIENVFSGVLASRRFYFEATNFVDNDEEIANTDIFNLGTNDDIDDDGDDWQIANGTMQPGIGYAAIAKNAPSYPDTQDFLFTGVFNNGEISIPLINNSLGAYNDWNFISNPYPGPIDISTFLSVNSGIIGAVHFWDQDTPENSNAPGNEGLNFSKSDYASHNGIGGTAAIAGNTPNGFIASGQGFFVEALSATNVVFNNSMRNNINDNSQFFKGSKVKKQPNQDNKIWLDIISDNGYFNQILIGYVDGATSGNDEDFYDTKKILAADTRMLFYSTIKDENNRFAIQGKNTNDLNNNEVIPLGFATSLDEITNYTISISQLQGAFLSNQNIYLKDKLLNRLYNLKTETYSFTSDTGIFNDRFEIVFNANALSEDITLKNNTLKIIELENDNVQFSMSNNLNIKAVKIFDLLGRQLYDFKGEKNTEIYKLSNLSSAIYIAKVELSNGAIITKKAFKK